MKLATLKSPRQPLDGELILVDQSNTWALRPDSLKIPHLRHLLENWQSLAPQMQKLSIQLNQQKNRCPEAFAFDPRQCHSPLPRSFAWLDGSAFLHHVRLVRKARGAELPPSLLETPLMYQGGSDTFLAPYDTIPYFGEEYGTDFESEVGIITDFVPMGTKANQAHQYIRLVVIINDVSLRGLIPEELAQGFGFLQSKPSSAFAPLALTLDELGEHFHSGRLHLPLQTDLKGEFFGNPDAGEMHFSFYQLIEHAARTRHLAAGTIIGSGTVSNENPTRGSSCIVEKRMLEKIKTGNMAYPFLRPGDKIRIRMQLPSGENLFGDIEQIVAEKSIS